MLSMVLVIIASAVGAEACEHMASATMPSEQKVTYSPEQTVSEIVYLEHATEANRSAIRDVDGCLTRCCQGSGGQPANPAQGSSNRLLHAPCREDAS